MSPLSRLTRGGQFNYCAVKMEKLDAYYKREEEKALAAELAERRAKQEKRVRMFEMDPHQRDLMERAGIDPYQDPIVPGRKHVLHTPPDLIRDENQVRQDPLTTSKVEQLVDEAVDLENFPKLVKVREMLHAQGVYDQPNEGISNWGPSKALSAIFGGDYCGAGNTGGNFTRAPTSSGEWVCAGHDVLSYSGNEGPADQWFQDRVRRSNQKVSFWDNFSPKKHAAMARASIGSLIFNFTKQPRQDVSLGRVSQGFNGTLSPNPGPKVTAARRAAKAAAVKAVRRVRTIAKRGRGGRRGRGRRYQGGIVPLARPARRLRPITTDSANYTRASGEILLTPITSDAASADGDVMMDTSVYITDAVFGRLALFAHAYEFYRGAWWLTYEPRSAASSTGAIVFYFDPDVDDDITIFPPNQRSMVASQHTGAATVKVWQDGIARRPEPKITPLGGWLYTTRGTEARLASPGRIVVINNGGIANDTVVGKLKLGFSVEFASANYEPFAASFGLPVVNYEANVPNQTAARPFGSDTPDFSGYPNYLVYQGTGSTNSRFLLRNTQVSTVRLLIIYRVTGTGLGTVVITATGAGITFTTFNTVYDAASPAATSIISYGRMDVVAGSVSSAGFDVSHSAATTFTAAYPRIYILPFTELLSLTSNKKKKPAEIITDWVHEQDEKCGSCRSKSVR